MTTQQQIAAQIEAAQKCATCALRDDCDKSATKTHWRSVFTSCINWVKWNGR